MAGEKFGPIRHFCRCYRGILSNILDKYRCRREGENTPSLEELILARHTNQIDDAYLDPTTAHLMSGFTQCPEMGKRMQDWGIRPVF